MVDCMPNRSLYLGSSENRVPPNLVVYQHFPRLKLACFGGAYRHYGPLFRITPWYSLIESQLLDGLNMVKSSKITISLGEIIISNHFSWWKSRPKSLKLWPRSVLFPRGDPVVPASTPGGACDPGRTAGGRCAKKESYINSNMERGTWPFLYIILYICTYSA